MFKKLKQKISEEQVLPRGAVGRAGSLPPQVRRGVPAGRRVRWTVVGACEAFHPAGQGRASPGEALVSCGSVGPASPPREGRVAQAWPTEGSGVGRLAGIAPRVAVSAGRLR